MLYNLSKFKTPLWFKYTYLFLKKNKINLIISTLKKKRFLWVRFLKQKNFILAGIEDPHNSCDIYDFPFYLTLNLVDFYIFFILIIFFKVQQSKIYNFFLYYLYLKKYIFLLN